jgi:hypothetical protein
VLAAYRWAATTPPLRRAAGARDRRRLHGRQLRGRRLPGAEARGRAAAGLQLLVYPCVDVASQTPSMTTYADAFPLDAADDGLVHGPLHGPDDDPADPRLSPLRAEDLAAWRPPSWPPPASIPLVDQGEAYAGR